MQLINTFIIIIICNKAYVDSQPIPSEQFPHKAILDSRSENVWLFWKFDDKLITFEMFGKTTGWVGVGISPNGGMIGADMFVGWVKDGVAYITDRHGGDRNAYPERNEDQDVTLLGGSEENGWTRIKFRRHLAGCEVDYDITITASTMRMIWALGQSDPEGGDIAPIDYHGSSSTSRGGRSLFLLESSGGEGAREEGNIEEIYLINNQTLVPSVDTYYSCKLIAFPQVPSKRHVIRIEPVIQEGNENVVHHILLYQCRSRPTNSSNIGRTHECYTDNMPPDFQACDSVIYAWAIGGEVYYFPDQVGFPIGTDDGPEFVVLEVHYDNPEIRAGIRDSSGLKLVYTDALRKYDAGILEVGHTVFPYTHIIPPRTESFKSYGECSAACIGEEIDSLQRDSIQIFGAMLHSHLLGREITVRHLTNNGSTELPYITQDTSYDFNYQEAKIFSKEVSFSKGDTMQVVCDYNSLSRSKVTLGGLSTLDEMCLAYIFYYPKISVTSCTSGPVTRFLYPFFGIQGFNLTSPVGFTTRSNLNDILITSPSHLAGITLDVLLDSINWTAGLVETFGDFARDAYRFERCVTRTSIKPLNLYFPPNITQPYRPPVLTCDGTMVLPRATLLLVVAMMAGYFLVHQ